MRKVDDAFLFKGEQKVSEGRLKGLAYLVKLFKILISYFKRSQSLHKITVQSAFNHKERLLGHLSVMAKILIYAKFSSADASKDSNEARSVDKVKNMFS